MTADTGQLQTNETNPFKINSLINQLAERIRRGNLTDLNINGATALTSPATDDVLPIFDTSATTNKAITLANLWTIINAFTEDTSPDSAADFIATYDASAAAAKKVSFVDLLKTINGLTEDTSPDGAADFLLTYDASASTVKKTLLHRATAFNIAQFTRDVSTASGTQAITGLGFKPKMVIMFGGINNSAATSWGASNASSHFTIYNNGALTANTWGSYQLGIAVIEQGGGNQNIATIQSLDSDGFTISWTKNGSPTGTALYFCLVLR